MNDVANAAGKSDPLSGEEARLIDAWWRAANYLSVGQIYLLDNPLLKQPLELAHIKPRLLGHWGTTPGQNPIYVHPNRIIKKFDLNMINISGPCHGGPAVVGNTYLEGTDSEIYADVTACADARVRPKLMHRWHVLEIDPFDYTVWALPEVKGFLGLRRGILFDRNLRGQPNDLLK